MGNSLQLTPRFTQAVDYARQIHVSLRKGTQMPYMAHLLGVASLVLGETGHVPFPVTEDMAIAALLHDAVEDEGGLPRLRDIEAKFGNKVAKIVEGCTDSFVEYPDKKQEWEERKSSYIERLWNEPPETLLVSVADKLYNARDSNPRRMACYNKCLARRFGRASFSGGQNVNFSAYCS
jgi:(p)ppGpp synthase/HD superfamily hydrolase